MDTITPHTESIVPRRVVIDRDRWVSIRPIERSDASALSDFYASLSVESRHRRFLSCGLGPSRQITARLAGAPGVVGILREAGPLDGAIVAHASVQPDGGSGSAEISFAVADEFQGRGIGARLVESVLEQVRELGLQRLTATMLVGNTPMRHLLGRAGLAVVLDTIDDGVEEVVLSVDRDSPFVRGR